MPRMPASNSPDRPPVTQPKAAQPAQAARTPLAVAGESCSRSVRLSRQDIATFAQLSGDSNPLHHDARAAQRARHGEIIVSGQHSTSLLIGLVSSHFSRPDAAFGRELLWLNVNFAFKAPLFAEQLVELQWRVASLEWHAKLAGLLAHVDGRAGVHHTRPAVVGRGVLLLRELPPSL